MSVIPVGYGRVTMEFQRDGDANPYDITFGVKVTGGADHEDLLNDVAIAFNAGSSVQDLQPANVTLTRIRGQFGNDGPPLVAEVNVGTAGSDSSGALQVPNVAIVVKKLTAFGGQKFRGRLYQPWCKEAQVDDAGILSGGAITAYQAAWSAFLTNLAAEGTIDYMVLLHNDITTPTKVESLLIRPKVGSQKRRLHL